MTRPFCGSGSIGVSDATDYPAFMRYALRSSLKANYTVENVGFRCEGDESMRGAIFLLSFAIGFLPWPAAVSAHDHDHMSHMEASKPLSGTSIYNLTSSWTNQDGKSVDAEFIAWRAGGRRHGLYQLQGHLPDDRGRYGRDRRPGEAGLHHGNSLCVLLAGPRHRYARAAHRLCPRPRARPRALDTLSRRRQGGARTRRGARRALSSRRQRRLRPFRDHYNPRRGWNDCRSAAGRAGQYRGNGEEAGCAVRPGGAFRETLRSAAR